MHILLTRPQADALPLAEKLHALGHKTTSLPMLDIVALPNQPLPPAARIAAYVFTSANAVRALAAVQDSKEKDAKPAYTEKPAYAIGAATAAACAAAGFTNIISGAGGVAQFADMILANPPTDNKAGHIIHITARHRAGNLCRLLVKGGLAAERLVLYDARACRQFPDHIAALLRHGDVDAVLFYSQRSAEIFIRLAQKAELAAHLPALAAACLSPAIAATAAKAGFCPIWTAAQPLEADLLASLPTSWPP